MSSGEEQSSNQRTTGPRRRRRRSAFRLVWGSPGEQATEYPGFFVLPRAQSQSRSSAAGQSLNPRWRQFKESAVVVILFGGLAAAAAFFFYYVASGWVAPEPRATPPFVSDPKALPTNSNDGGLGRR